MNNREKKQIKRTLDKLENHPKYTKEELSLISNIFYDRDDVLMTIRKFFLQGELNNTEETIVKTLTEDTIRVLRKCILPDINFHSPLVLGKDLWARIDMTTKLMEDAYWEIRSESILIKYLEEQFERFNGAGIKMKLTDLIYNDKKPMDVACYELKARNKVLNLIDECLRELRMLAISNAEVDNAEKIRMMNSNK